MQTYNINIFEDTGNSHDLDNSQGYDNSQERLLDFRPTSTSTMAHELLPLHNSPDEQFQQNALLNGKTKYEEENTIIKSLEEELVSMKHKLSFVYEKDEEIGTLKGQVSQLKKETNELQSLSEDAVKLRLENKQLRDQFDLLQLQTDSSGKLALENKLLREKLQEFMDKSDTSDTEQVLLEDDIEDIEEMIDVNVPQLRSVLTKRLKDKQSQHIEALIATYGLKRKNKVKKSVMEKMLEEAIHL